MKESPIIGICHLCSLFGELRKSHIIPKWCWTREIRGSAGRFADLGEDKIHGEAITYPLLCNDCEQRFGVWDNDASKFNEDPTAPYGKWLLKFATSISWRVLEHACHADDSGFKDSHLQCNGIQRALSCWRAFLLGDAIEDTGEHTQHLFRISKNFDRRGVIDTCISNLSDNSAIVFSRFGSFAIMGLIQTEVPEVWRNSKSRIIGAGGGGEANDYGSDAMFEFLKKREIKMIQAAQGFVGRHGERLERACK